MNPTGAVRPAALLLPAFLATACSPAVAPSQEAGMLPYMRSTNALRALSGTGAGKIKHIVYIVQENRSFDNMFQGYPGADTRPTATTRTARRSG